MTDALQLGLGHALFAAAYVTGAALPALVALTPVAAVVALRHQLRHRTTVWRLKRQTRRSGRAVTRADTPPFPFPCHCASLPPGRRDLTGHEHGCPDHPR